MKDYAGATQGQVGTAFLLEGVTYTFTSLAAGLVTTFRDNFASSILFDFKIHFFPDC